MARIEFEIDDTLLSRFTAIRGQDTLNDYARKILLTALLQTEVGQFQQTKQTEHEAAVKNSETTRNQAIQAEHIRIKTELGL